MPEIAYFLNVAHKKVVSEPRSSDMAEDTRFTQLKEVVGRLHARIAMLKEEKYKQQSFMESILQQLNNLASSHENLVQITSKLNSSEGSSNTMSN